MSDHDALSSALRRIGAAMDMLPDGERAEFRKTISETDVYLFAGITGDLHTNHIDEERMQATPLGGRIAHGVLGIGLMSTATSLLTMRLPHDVPCVSKGCDVRFRAPVRFGDTISATAVVTEKLLDRRELRMRAECRNQRGELVSEAAWYIKFLLPEGVAPGAPARPDAEIADTPKDGG